MTSGSLWKNILKFSLPLMMTQVLEVLFNLRRAADLSDCVFFADIRESKRDHIREPFFG